MAKFRVYLRPAVRSDIVVTEDVEGDYMLTQNGSVSIMVTKPGEEYDEEVAYYTDVLHCVKVAQGTGREVVE